MSIRRLFPYLATAANALSVALPQVLGLVYLGPADYGSYSLLYLGYALSSSTVLSVVCEAWARRGAAGSPADYLRTGSLLALVFALLTAGTGLVIGVHPAAASTAGLAVLLATTWTNGRYLLTAQGAWGRLLLGDATGLGAAGVLIGAIVLLAEVDLMGVLTFWAVSAAGAVLVTGTLAVPSIAAGRRWVLDHRRQIGTLLADSSLLDASSIGVPFLLYPLLGAASFGKYRAISSAAFPIRLVFAAVRPVLVRLPVETFRRVRVQLLLVSASAVLGGMAAICVWFVARELPGLGTIGAIGEYASHVGVFIMVTTLSTAVYLFCRIRSSAEVLLTGRVLQTVVMVAAPLTGFVVGGEAGAVAGFVVGATLTAVVWYGALARTRPATDADVDADAADADAMGSPRPEAPTLLPVREQG